MSWLILLTLVVFANGQTQSAPEVSTNAPEVSTNAPDVSTNVPEVSTNAPEVSTNLNNNASLYSGTFKNVILSF